MVGVLPLGCWTSFKKPLKSLPETAEDGVAITKPEPFACDFITPAEDYPLSTDLESPVVLMVPLVLLKELADLRCLP